MFNCIAVAKRFLWTIWLSGFTLPFVRFETYVLLCKLNIKNDAYIWNSAIPMITKGCGSCKFSQNCCTSSTITMISNPVSAYPSRLIRWKWYLVFVPIDWVSFFATLDLSICTKFVTRTTVRMTRCEGNNGVFLFTVSSSYCWLPLVTKRFRSLF